MLFTNSKCWPSGGSRTRKQNVGEFGWSCSVCRPCLIQDVRRSLYPISCFRINTLTPPTDSDITNSSDHTNPNKLINKWWLIVFCLFNRPIKISLNFCLFVCWFRFYLKSSELSHQLLLLHRTLEQTDVEAFTVKELVVVGGSHFLSAAVEDDDAEHWRWWCFCLFFFLCESH